MHFGLDRRALYDQPCLTSLVRQQRACHTDCQCDRVEQAAAVSAAGRRVRPLLGQMPSLIVRRAGGMGYCVHSCEWVACLTAALCVVGGMANMGMTSCWVMPLFWLPNYGVTQNHPVAWHGDLQERQGKGHTCKAVLCLSLTTGRGCLASKTHK